MINRATVSIVNRNDEGFSCYFTFCQELCIGIWKRVNPGCSASPGSRRSVGSHGKRSTQRVAGVGGSRGCVTVCQINIFVVDIAAIGQVTGNNPNILRHRTIIVGSSNCRSVVGTIYCHNNGLSIRATVAIIDRHRVGLFNRIRGSEELNICVGNTEFPSNFTINTTNRCLSDRCSQRAQL